MYRFPRKENLLAMTDPPRIARIPPVIRRLNLHQISPESPHLSLPEKELGSETQATRKLEEYAMLTSLGQYASSGQASMGTLDYPCV